MNFFSLTEILRCPLRLFVLSTGSEVLWSYSSLHKEGGGTGIFSGQVFKCDLSVYRVLQISLFICDVSPFLDQVFRCFFSMDNLRDYGEDEPASSSSLGRSVAKLPSSSKGPSAPLPAQASVMAGSSPAVVPVTSGPVPTVSAPSQPASSVPQDSAPPPPGLLDDLSPPPSPAEPYEDFMARVRRELSTLPAHATQSVAAVPPCASVTATTTGTRLPTPFSRFEDSSWAFQPQVPNTRIRMPLPAYCYTAPPSPWVWPGRGSSLPLPWSVYTSLLRCRLPPQDLVDLQDVSQDLSQGALPLFLHLRFLLLTSSTPPPPALSRIFSGCHAPFYPNHHNICAIVLFQREHCHSHDDAAGCRDHFPGTYPGDDPRVERRIHGRHESLLATVCGWHSTSANSGSRCSSCDHGPRLAAAAESLWRPRGVTGSA